MVEHESGGVYKDIYIGKYCKSYKEGGKRRREGSEELRGFIDYKLTRDDSKD